MKNKLRFVWSNTFIATNTVINNLFFNDNYLQYVKAFDILLIVYLA